MPNLSLARIIAKFLRELSYDAVVEEHANRGRSKRLSYESTVHVLLETVGIPSVEAWAKNQCGPNGSRTLLMPGGLRHRLLLTNTIHIRPPRLEILINGTAVIVVPWGGSTLEWEEREEVDVVHPESFRQLESIVANMYRRSTRKEE